MKIFDILENDSGQRLDRFFMKVLPLATRGLVFKLNRKWKIKVSSDNGVSYKKQDNEYKLQTGEKIKLFLSPEDVTALTVSKHPEQKTSKLAWKQLDKQDIVYEDAGLLVVNKNFWINVHPWDYKTKELSLIEQVQDYLGDKLNSLTFKPSLCHRIDRDTSGIVMIAKNKNTLVQLMKDFREHKNIRKTYYALVLWKIGEMEGTIDKKILRIENAKNENKVQIHEKWDKALTKYKVLSYKKLKTQKEEIDVTEVLVDIETWRMHQIRIHMASIGHPIIGDKTYGDLSFNHYVCKEFWFCRQALHAFKIEFMNYHLKKRMQLEARLKDDIKNFISKLT